MKKAIAFGLAVLFVLSAVICFAPPLQAQQTMPDICYDNWGRCRVRALDLDVAWWKVAVLLTICDFSLGKCLLVTP